MATTENIIINVDLESSEAENGLKDLNKQLNKQTEATGKAEEATEDYNSTLIDTAKDTKIAGVSINSLTKAFKSTIGGIKSSVTALKSFKIALAATGIGLLIIALGTLATWLTKTQKGMDLVNRVMNVMSTVVNQVIDRIAKLGEAISLLFSGEFEAAYDKAAEAVTGFGDAIGEAIVQGNELSDLQEKLRQRTLDLTAADAQLEQQFERSKRISDDVTKSLEQRLEAAEKAEEALIQQTKNREELAQLELDILEKQAEGAQTTFEENLAIEEKRAEIFRIRAEREARGTEAQNKRNQLQNELEAQRIAETEAAALESAINQVDIEREKYKQIGDITKKFDKDQLMAKFELDKQIRENAKIQAQTEIDIEYQKNQAIYQGTADLANSIAGLLGQEAEAGKAFAAFAALLNMFEAISKANTLIFPLNLLAIATATANGLAAIRNINSTPIPKVQIQETPFAEGGHIQGASHARGGVWLNAEGGEYIVNKNAMRDPINRGIIEAINNNMQSPGIMFAQGGQVDQMQLQLSQIERAAANQRAVLVTEDLYEVVGRVAVSEEVATL